MLNFSLKIGICLFILSLAAITYAEDGVLHREGNPDYYEKFNNNRMDEAIAEAKSTIDDFASALKSKDPAYENFSLKKGFQFGDNNREFIWISDIKQLEDGTFQGIINNEPVNNVGVKYGQTVTINKNEIADWMYINNKKLVGGYSIVALTYGTPAQQQYENNYGIVWSDYKFLHLK